MNKVINVVTRVFCLGEYEEAPDIAIITIDEKGMEKIEKYLKAVQDMKDAGLNPSVLNTYDCANFAFYHFGYDKNPLITEEVPENMVFPDKEIEQEFNEAFNEVDKDDYYEAQEGTLLSDLEFDHPTESDRMFIRHDNQVWFGANMKYSGVALESECFGEKFLNEVLRPFFK